MANMIRVLIVDDSSLIRNVLAHELSIDPEIEIVGTASDPFVAKEKIAALQPDVITLDVEMPRMNGLEFLRHLMSKNPVPVVMVSSYTRGGEKVTLDALEAGAIDFVTKPSIDTSSTKDLENMLAELRVKIKAAFRANVSGWESRRNRMAISGAGSRREIPQSAKNLHDKIVVIGASTGGTEAVKEIISDLPKETPGIVVALHMPAGFTKNFAERLSAVCDMEVTEATFGDTVSSGKALIAPGDFHMMVLRSAGGYVVMCDKKEKVNGHRPSVDVLMTSVAQCAGANAVGVILTGMGSDGAKGMLAMKKAGARAIAQDKESSLVFGMPSAAVTAGGAERFLPLDKISHYILDCLAEMK